MTSDKSNGALIVAGSASGALIAGFPGAIVGALVGYLIEEAVKCPRCGSKMVWTIEHRWLCMVCGYIK